MMIFQTCGSSSCHNIQPNIRGAGFVGFRISQTGFIWARDEAQVKLHCNCLFLLDFQQAVQLDACWFGFLWVSQLVIF